MSASVIDELDECRKCFHAHIHSKGGHFSIYCDSRIHKQLSLFGSFLSTITQNGDIVLDRILLFFDIMCFTRYCSDTLYVWWEIWREYCCEFTAESNSERILKISQNLSKLWTNFCCLSTCLDVCLSSNFIQITHSSYSFSLILIIL